MYFEWKLYFVFICLIIWNVNMKYSQRFLGIYGRVIIIYNRFEARTDIPTYLVFFFHVYPRVCINLYYSYCKYNFDFYLLFKILDC